jgi:hypothetical protein
MPWAELAEVRLSGYCGTEIAIAVAMLTAGARRF